VIVRPGGARAARFVEAAAIRHPSLCAPRCYDDRSEGPRQGCSTRRFTKTPAFL